MARRRREDEEILMPELGLTAADFPVEIPQSSGGALPPPPGYDYEQQAKRYLSEADTLSQQAAAPMPRASGLKEHLIEAARAFIEGMANPRDPYAQEMRRQDEQRLNRRELVAQAEAARTRAGQQQQLAQGARREANDQANFNRQQSFNEEVANRPKPFEAGPGTTYGTRDPKTGEPTIQGTVPFKPATDSSDEKFVDRYDETTNHMFRDFYHEGAPENVYFSKDLGKPRNVVGAENSGLTVYYTDPETGLDTVGVRNRGSNVVVPARIQGQSGPVQGATAGRDFAKEGADAVANAANAERLYTTMRNTLARIESGKSQAIGADDMVLLSNHIAMTFGNVKGARTGRDIIEAHRNAISADQRLSRMVDNVLNGSELTPSQRHEFVDLARRRVEELKQTPQALRDVYQETRPGQTPASGAGPQMPASNTLPPGWSIKRVK